MMAKNDANATLKLMIVDDSNIIRRRIGFQGVTCRRDLALA